MSSLFGTPAKTQTSSLFTDLPSSAPAPNSSIFGNAPTASPATTAGGGLFGSTPAPQNQQAPSLFSNLGQAGQQPQQSKVNPFPSLFGSTSQPQQQTSAPTGASIFAPAASQPAPGASIFGNTSGNQGPGASIFANAPPQQQQQQQQGQGQGQGQSQPHNASLGSVAPKGAQPGHFDSLLERSRKRTRDADGGPGFQDLPGLQLGLGDISKRVRELGGTGTPSRNGGVGADSRAHYLLAASGVNLGATRRDLDSLANQPAVNASLSHVPDWDPDTHKYVEQLQQRQTARMVQEGLEQAQKRFDAFLEEHVDINWDLQRKRIYQHFGLTSRDEDDEDDLATPYGKGSFGHSVRRSKFGKNQSPSKSTMNRSIFGQSGLQKSVIGSPGTGSGNTTLFADVLEKNGTTAQISDDRYLRDKQRRYAEKVQALNQARLRRARIRDGTRQQQPSYPILQEFLSLEDQPGGDTPRQIADAYKALILIAKEGTAQERQYAEDYLDEMPNSARSIRIRKQIINGSRQSLEKTFFEQLESLVTRNPREANIGGVPTALSKVRAYVRIRAARKDLAPDNLELAMMGEDHCWALLFYLLRTGLVHEAAGYVVEHAAHFRTIDRNIISFLTAYAKNPERRLDGRVQRDCNNIYSAMTKIAPGDSVDPYRVACYKIIGRCDLSRRSLDHVIRGVDDWIWLQFNLAREVNRAEESAGDVFGLDEVRETIREIGQRHFAKGAEGLGGFGTFFHLQVLGGLFEQAVSYLYSSSYTAAVHFAIALDYYGLLRVSDFNVSETELLTYNTKELPQLSFGRMIGHYTRDFRASNVESAVDYLALLCLNADLTGQLGKSQAALCHEALRELVLETREFARLLGDIRSDGVRLKGAIEERLEILSIDSQADLLKTVTIQAASVADDNGRITDAVLLYHLSEDYDNVINILNRALSEAVSVDIGTEPPRLEPLRPRSALQVEQSYQNPAHNATSSLSLTSVDDPVELAANMMHLYASNAMYFSKIRPANREACDILLQMCYARTKVVAGAWPEAYELIGRLHLLPLQAKGHIPTIRAAATAFNTMPTPISRNVGPLLLWTITCIGRERERLAQRTFEGGTTRALSEELLSAAKDLMVFAGLVKYRLGERVWEAVCGVAGDAGAH